MLPTRRPTILLVVALAAGVALTITLVATTTGYPLDDTWIHLDYARSLVDHFTFGYTPGEWQNGSTAPLWSVLVALPLAVGVPPELAAKLIGLVALCALIFFTYRIVLQLGGPVAAAAAALIVAFDPWVSVLSISGMEVVGAMAAVTAAIDGVLRRHWPQGGIALAACGLLRPELGLFVAILVVSARKLARKEGARIPLRGWLWLVLPAAVAGGAWMLYGLAINGRAFPNSYMVKTYTGLHLVPQLDSLRALLLGGPWFASAVVIGISLVATNHFCQPKQRLIGPMVLSPFVLLCGYVFMLPLGRDYGPMRAGSAENLYHARYSLLLLPWLFVWVTVGAKLLFDGIRELVGRRYSARVATLLAAGTLVVAAGLVVPWWQGHRGILRQAYRANCNEIQNAQVKMGKWIDEELDEDAVIAVSDAGALRYFSNRYVVDLRGLNTPDLIGRLDRVRKLHEYGVTHLVIWPNWHKQMLKDERLKTEIVGRAHIESPTMIPGDLFVFEIEDLQEH